MFRYFRIRWTSKQISSTININKGFSKSFNKQQSTRSGRLTMKQINGFQLKNLLKLDFNLFKNKKKRDVKF